MLGTCGGSRARPDDGTLHADLASDRTGAEVTFDARLLSEPQQAAGHEHLEVVTPLGDRLEIDHNTDLSQWVPAHTGDSLVVHGQLYIDAPGQQGVHCTHAHTSSGCPEPGWIDLHGTYYE